MSEREILRRLSALEKENHRLKRQLAQPVRQHSTQSQQLKLHKGLSDKIQTRDMNDLQPNAFMDDSESTAGLVIRINGKKVRFDGIIEE